MTPPPSSLPIACSLGRDAAGRRTAEWHALLSRTLIRRTSTGDGVRLELRRLPGVQRELERLVAAEQECCPFMAMSVDTTEREVIGLAVTAPELAAPILDQLLPEAWPR
jgi:hypothetical protein